jgi:hypothetical protein
LNRAILGLLHLQAICSKTSRDGCITCRQGQAFRGERATLPFALDPFAAKFPLRPPLLMRA